MISKYVKEQKRYTQDELRKIFECTADETVQIIRKLKEYGIVKNVKKSDRQKNMDGCRWICCIKSETKN